MLHNIWLKYLRFHLKSLFYFILSREPIDPVNCFKPFYKFEKYPLMRLTNSYNNKENTRI